MNAAPDNFDFLIDDSAVRREVRRMRRHMSKSLARFTDPEGDLPLSADLLAALAACDAVFAAAESTLAVCAADDDADAYEAPSEPIAAGPTTQARPALRLIPGGLSDG